MRNDNDSQERHESLELGGLIYDQKQKDRMYRDSVIPLAREIYVITIRDAGYKITQADMARAAESSIDAAKVFVEQVRDTL